MIKRIRNMFAGRAIIAALLNECIERCLATHSPHAVALSYIDMTFILINGNEVDPAIGKAQDPDSTKSDFIYVVVSHTLSILEQRELEDNQAEILQYMEVNTYECRYKPQDLQPIRALPFVRFANVYPCHAKITKALRDTVL